MPLALRRARSKPAASASSFRLLISKRGPTPVADRPGPLALAWDPAMASPKDSSPPAPADDEAWEAELAEAEETLLFESAAPAGPLQDELEATEVQAGQVPRPAAAAAPLRAIAPEVSPGVWREKAYV